MGIGVSLFLIAVGAILTWAVSATANGIDINAVGVILMIVGIVGMLLSFMFWSSWGGPRVARSTSYADGPAPAVRETSYVDEPVARRATYVENEPATTRRRRVVEDDVA